MAKKKKNSSYWFKRELDKRLYYPAILFILLLCVIFAFAYSIPAVGIPLENQFQDNLQNLLSSWTNPTPPKNHMPVITIRPTPIFSHYGHPNIQGVPPNAYPTDTIVTPSSNYYTDPDDYFSIFVPNDWKIDVSFGGSYGAVSSENQIKLEGIKIFSSDKTQVLIQVREAKPTCANTIHSNEKYTSINNFPAYYDSEANEWFINSNRAVYTIQPWYPGAPGTYNGLIPPPSVPPQELKANQQITNKIINSFSPIDSSQFTCN